MTRLLLVRHAIAEPRGDAWPDDACRPLTDKGVARMRDIAGRLKALGETAEVVLTSPLARAVETARILVAEWIPSSAPQVVEVLAPGHTPAETMAALSERLGPRVAVVGHEPDLGALAAWLIGARRPLPFKKGGVARIDVESLSRPRDGELIWLATPKMLRASE